MVLLCLKFQSPQIIVQEAVEIQADSMHSQTRDSEQSFDESRDIFALQFDQLEEHLTCSWDVLCPGHIIFLTLRKIRY